MIGGVRDGLAAFAATAVFLEAIIRLGVAVHPAAIAERAGRALAVMRSARISEHWKEKAILRYAAAIFTSTGFLAAALAAAGAGFAAIYALGAAQGPLKNLARLSQPALVDLALLTAFGLAYLPLRRMLPR